MNTEEGEQYSVFVYGTLKKGQPNHYVIEGMDNAMFVGEATTINKYPLVITGQFNLPMLLNVKGTGKIVRGEFYEVGRTALERLDEFEGHPTLYERLEIDITVDSGENKASTRRCWTYFIKEFSQRDIDQPHLDSYDTNGEHGLAYDTRDVDEWEKRHRVLGRDTGVFRRRDANAHSVFFSDWLRENDELEAR